VYGDNPDQGVVRGNHFLHPKLRLAVDFPDGWDVSNSQSEVVAKQRDASVFIILQIVNRPAGRTIEETAVRAMERAGFRAVAGGSATINGLDAFVGTYEGSLQGVGRVQVRAGHIVYNRSVFMMAGIAPADAYDRSEPAMTSTIRSFRPLTAGEAESIHPNRIELYRAARRAASGVVESGDHRLHGPP
jgi:predicted Zn-dependent protease